MSYSTTPQHAVSLLTISCTVLVLPIVPWLPITPVDIFSVTRYWHSSVCVGLGRATEKNLGQSSGPRWANAGTEGDAAGLNSYQPLTKPWPADGPLDGAGPIDESELA